MSNLFPSQQIESKGRMLCFALFCLAILCLAAPVAEAQAAQETVPHTFVYQSDAKRDSVTVAGTFNGWDKHATPLTADTDGKAWRVTLNLAPGKYAYKFVVNTDTWVTDPAAPAQDTDGNSVLLATSPDYAAPASPLDGVTARSALRHTDAVPYLSYDRGQLILTLRTRPGDLKRVQIKVGARRIPMAVVTTTDLYAFYSARLLWDRKKDLAYTFALTDGAKTLEFGANGLGTQAEPFRLSAKQFKPFVVPDWVEGAVFYQIFPDRFANGDKANDPPDVQPWDAAPTWGNRFGGDVQGVRQHLPYLSDLGISAIYFNPVFKSPSNHRYDVEDYKTVDPQFGTNAEFAALTRDLQGKGIRTVMDFVFNHSAAAFPPFVDVRAKGEASAYKDWYFIRSYPVQAPEHPNYAAYGDWWGMPKLNEANPATRDYMLDVVTYWKREVPLAGLRLDAADQVDSSFWRALRLRVKGLDPNTWILGEMWGDASPWLGGDQWDAAMNYPFLFANVDFFADGKIAPSAYAERLMQQYHDYGPQVSRNLMNSLSTHDTPRFLTRCRNDQDLDRLAATVQFTWIGAPCIYYGEEVGMQGGNDPDNRRGMRWDLATTDNPMLRYYKRLIHLRRTNRALQSGDPAILLTDDRNKTFAFARTLGNDVAIVAVNRSDKPQTLTVPLPDNAAMQAVRRSGLTDALSGHHVSPGGNHSLHLTLAPLRAAILLPTTYPVGVLPQGGGRR